MSVPGLVVLYGGVMQKRWSVNSMMMAFVAFAIVLIAWVLYGFKMGFGSPIHIFGAERRELLRELPGQARAGPRQLLSLLGQGTIPLLGDVGKLAFPQSTLVYFQFVFAAITPILMLGSVLGRINFKAWIPFVLIWSSLIYTVNAFLIWGGGYFAQQGALDFSGGYVIHLAAGVSGFVAAAVIGPRLQRDREVDAPNNLAMVAVGAGLLWLGWNGFNGGDPYLANADASAAVLNTNLCTAVAFLAWVGLDYATGRKPSLIGSVNGMITGLVAITPGAGFVNGWGAIAIGLIAASIVYLALNYLSRMAPFRNVDDTLGVVYTHGFAGCAGGLLTGIFANSAMASAFGVSASGLISGGGFDLLKWQAADGGVGDRVLRGRHLHRPAPRRPVRPAADGREGHGGGRRRGPRPRGLPLGRPLARLPVRDPGVDAGSAAGAGPRHRVRATPSHATGDRLVPAGAGRSSLAARGPGGERPSDRRLDSGGPRALSTSSIVATAGITAAPRGRRGQDPAYGLTAGVAARITMSSRTRRERELGDQGHADARGDQALDGLEVVALERDPRLEAGRVAGADDVARAGRGGRGLHPRLLAAGPRAAPCPACRRARARAGAPRASGPRAARSGAARPRASR